MFLDLLYVPKINWAVIFILLFSVYAHDVSASSLDLIVDNAEELKTLYKDGSYKQKKNKSHFVSKKALEKEKSLIFQIRKFPDKAEKVSKEKLLRKHDPIFSNASEFQNAIQQLNSASKSPRHNLQMDEEIKKGITTLGLEEKETAKIAPDKLQGLVFVQSDAFVSDPKVRKLYEQKRELHALAMQSLGFVHNELEEAISNAFEDLKSYIGQPISVSLVDKIVVLLKDSIRKSNIPFTNIYIPPQKIEGGIIFVVIKPSMVEDVRIARSEYSSEVRLLKTIDQEPGEPIDIKRLERDLAILSLHPDRQAKASFSAGSSDNTTLIDIDLDEQKPWRVYASLSNDGSEDLDEKQFSLGGYHNNLWGKDHKVSYQYTTSADRRSLKAHNLRYDVPFLKTQNLSVSYTNSKTKASILDNAFETKGRYSQLGVRHQTSLLDTLVFTDGWSLRSHKVSIGADYKDIKGDILFTLFGDPLDTGLGADVEIANGILEYEGLLNDPYKGQTKLNAAFVYSPGGLSGKNSDSDFEATRANTSSNYMYARLSGDRTMPLSLNVFNKNLNFNSGLQGQLSPDRLLGSERFVNYPRRGFRGYNSGVFSGDSCVSGYLELKSSKYNLVSSPYYKDALQTAVFTDFGVFYNNNPEDSEDKKDGIFSTGVSFDYQINDKANFIVTLSQDLSAQDKETNQKLTYRLILSH